MSIDILCLGEAMAEFNQDGSDGRFRLGFGGDTSNAAIAAARAGARTGYVTRLGNDFFADGLMALWQREGVDTTGVSRDQASPTGVYVVTHGPQGHVFTYLRKGSAASRMTPDNLPRALISSARILHVSGISQAISQAAAETVSEAIAIARQAGVLVSYDTNYRPRLWPIDQARRVIHAAMATADIARPSLEDARLLTGLERPEDIIRFYRDLGARIVALTLGAEGAMIGTADGELTRIAPLKVSAVDATGAGDAFTGNLLARLAAGDSPAAAGRFANAAAALSTQSYGAIAGLPQKAATEAYLAEIS